MARSNANNLASVCVCVFMYWMNCLFAVSAMSWGIAIAERVAISLGERFKQSNHQRSAPEQHYCKPHIPRVWCFKLCWKFRLQCSDSVRTQHQTTLRSPHIHMSYMYALSSGCGKCFVLPRRRRFSRPVSTRMSLWKPFRWRWHIQFTVFALRTPLSVSDATKVSCASANNHICAFYLCSMCIMAGALCASGRTCGIFIISVCTEGNACVSEYNFRNVGETLFRVGGPFIRRMKCASSDKSIMIYCSVAW